MAALCRPACAEMVALLFEEKADGAVLPFLRETTYDHTHPARGRGGVRE